MNRARLTLHAVLLASLTVPGFAASPVAYDISGPARLVRDINQGLVENGPQTDSSGAEVLAEMHGVLFAWATDADHGRELWRSDGTEAGTVFVKDLCPGTCLPVGGRLDGSVVVGGRLYFSVTSFSAGAGSPALWKTDGTPEGAVLVKDFAPGIGSVFGLTDVDGTLFFNVDDGVHGIELWRSDGSESGTVLIQDIVPGSASSGDSFDEPALTGNRAVFVIDDGFHGYEPWAARTAVLAGQPHRVRAGHRDLAGRQAVTLSIRISPR